MDLLRRFIFLFNRSGESTGNPLDLTIPICYYGHTYVAQPNSDELKRAAGILENRNKSVGKHFTSILSCYDEGKIILQDNNAHHTVREYEIRKIVVSCVDAKNQRLLAIFYDNDSSESSMGMECHLFLCRSKVIAKMAAKNIGEKLNKQCKQSDNKVPPEIRLDEVNIISRPNMLNDFDYENISKFFREEVFNLSVTSPEPSSHAPSSESSSTYLTVGCDSGCASTVPSVDTKSEETMGGIKELPPDLNSISSSSEDSRVKTRGNSKRVAKKIVNKDKPSAESLGDITKKNNHKKIISANRYSEHYELSGKKATIGNINDQYLENNKNKNVPPYRYSHQYELTGSKQNANTSKRFEKDDKYSTETLKNSSNKLLSGKSNMDKNKSEGDVTLTQNIQNRYSVHYDSDELVFNEKEETEEITKPNVTPRLKGKRTPRISSEPFPDYTFRTIDKRELHRLTYLCSTDI